MNVLRLAFAKALGSADFQDEAEQKTMIVVRVMSVDLTTVRQCGCMIGVVSHCQSEPCAGVDENHTLSP